MSETAFLIDVTLRYPANALGSDNPETTGVWRVLAVGATASEAIEKFLADMTLAYRVPEVVNAAVVADANSYDYFIVDSPLGGDSPA